MRQAWIALAQRIAHACSADGRMVQPVGLCPLQQGDVTQVAPTARSGSMTLLSMAALRSMTSSSNHPGDNPGTSCTAAIDHMRHLRQPRAALAHAAASARSSCIHSALSPSCGRRRDAAITFQPGRASNSLPPPGRSRPDAPAIEYGLLLFHPGFRRTGRPQRPANQGVRSIPRASAPCGSCR